MAVWYHDNEAVTGRIVRAPWVFYTVNFLAPRLPPPPCEDRVWPVGVTAPDSLVSEVFPWARPELDTDDRWFVDDLGGDDAGTFVSTVAVGGVRVRRDAVFLADERDAARHLGVVDLARWDCASGARPPATSLAVTVEVSAQGLAVSRTVVFTALRPSLEPSPQTSAG